MADNTYAPIIIDDLISDVESKDLHEEISETLHKKYLSDSANESDEVEGILFGNFQRLISSMTLEIRGHIKYIHFIVDTGSPRTYVCKEVLKSYSQLFFADLKGLIPVRLNKRQISVKVSKDHFSDLNILGTDFLSTHRAQLFIDFDQRYFTIKFKTSQTQVAPSDIIEREEKECERIEREENECLEAERLEAECQEQELEGMTKSAWKV
ncbi:hypothetical protein C1645_843958 [Glomus cerebriforme]|uniref:Aspartic peptidase domain-containing protein n=1 Tax=Glomus cerebriforme TaxID=658196 RepID=A0A397TLF0_9GLOM|nr:hypothetical protein C1645_843958 [Glomus cerebriforme]